MKITLNIQSTFCQCDFVSVFSNWNGLLLKHHLCKQFLRQRFILKLSERKAKPSEKGSSESVWGEEIEKSEYEQLISDSHATTTKNIVTSGDCAQVKTNRNGL